ncbi:MAG: protein kinase [Planctomycetota bacterium]|nr:protein kinase [Planctomycetota bacterium]
MNSHSPNQRDQQFLSWAVQTGALTPDYARQILNHRLTQSGSSSHVPIEHFLIQQQILNQSQIQYLVNLAAQHRSSASGSASQNLIPSGSQGGSHLSNSKDSHQSRMKKALAKGSGGLEADSTLAGYTIVEEIARGGMGAVYRAQRPGEGMVALKVMLAGENVEERQLTRFQREIEAHKELDHPHIIKLLDSGQEGKRLYYTMELVEGGSLASVIHNPDYEIQDKVELLSLVARAVGFAHGHGLFHRDLKPDNILLTKDGEPKITDFGLAKSLLTKSDLTKTGSTVGTPGYMAPEQVRGETKTTDQRCDVWALGVILYQLISGEMPFKGVNVPQLYEAIQNSEPQPITVASKQLKTGLMLVIRRCLEKEAENRYKTGLELAKDLETWLKEGHVSVDGQSQASRLARGLKKGKLSIVGPVMLVLLLILGVPGGYFFYQAQQKEAAIQQRKKAIEQVRKRLKKSISLARDKVQQGEESEGQSDYGGSREAFAAAYDSLSRTRQKAMRLETADLETLTQTKNWRSFTELEGKSLIGLARSWRSSAKTLSQFNKAREFLDEAKKIPSLSQELQDQRLIEQVTLDQRSGRWAQSLRDIEQFLQKRKSPAPAELLALMASLNLDLKRPDKALQNLQTLDSKNPVYQSLKARTLTQKQDWKRANALYSKLAPKNSSPYYRARIQFELLSPRRADGINRALAQLAQFPKSQSTRADFILAQLRLGQAEEGNSQQDRLPKDFSKTSAGLLIQSWQALLKSPTTSPEFFRQARESLSDIDFQSYAQFYRLGSLFGGDRGHAFEPLTDEEKLIDPLLRHEAESWLALEMREFGKGESNQESRHCADLTRLAQSQGQNPNLQSIFLVHNAIHDQGDWSKYEAAIRESPWDILLHYIPLLSRKQGDFVSSHKKTERELQSLGQSFSRRAQWLLELYRRYKKPEDLKNALALFAHARKLEPWLLDPWVLAIRALRRQKQFNDALALATEAKRLFPDVPDVVSLWILTRADMGQSSDDRTLARENLSRDTSSAFSLLAYARTLKDKRQDKEALSQLSALLTSSPQFIEARRLEIDILQRLKKTAEWRKKKQFLNDMLDPKQTRVDDLCDASEDFRISDIKRSFRLIDEAYRLNPESPEVYSAYCQARLVNRTPESTWKALCEYGWAFFMDVNFFDNRNNAPKAWKSLADTKSMAQKIEDKYNRGELVSTEEIWFVGFSRFLVLENAQGPGDKLQQILNWFERAFQRQPYNFTARALRGYLRVLTRHPGAESDLKLSVRYCPNSAWVRLGSALYCAQRKEWQRAFDHLEFIQGKKGQGYLHLYLGSFREFDPMRKMKRWKKLK